MADKGQVRVAGPTGGAVSALRLGVGGKASAPWCSVRLPLVGMQPSFLDRNLTGGVPLVQVTLGTNPLVPLSPVRDAVIDRLKNPLADVPGTVGLLEFMLSRMGRALNNEELPGGQGAAAARRLLIPADEAAALKTCQAELARIVSPDPKYAGDAAHVGNRPEDIAFRKMNPGLHPDVLQAFFGDNCGFRAMTPSLDSPSAPSAGSLPNLTDEDFLESFLDGNHNSPEVIGALRLLFLDRYARAGLLQIAPTTVRYPALNAAYGLAMKALTEYNAAPGNQLPAGIYDSIRELHYLIPALGALGNDVSADISRLITQVKTGLVKVLTVPASDGYKEPVQQALLRSLRLLYGLDSATTGRKHIDLLIHRGLSNTEGAIEALLDYRITVPREDFPIRAERTSGDFLGSLYDSFERVRQIARTRGIIFVSELNETPATEPDRKQVAEMKLAQMKNHPLFKSLNLDSRILAAQPFEKNRKPGEVNPFKGDGYSFIVGQHEAMAGIKPGQQIFAVVQTSAGSGTRLVNYTFINFGKAQSFLGLSTQVESSAVFTLSFLGHLLSKTPNGEGTPVDSIHLGLGGVLVDASCDNLMQMNNPPRCGDGYASQRRFPLALVTCRAFIERPLPPANAGEKTSYNEPFAYQADLGGMSSINGVVGKFLEKEKVLAVSRGSVRNGALAYLVANGISQVAPVPYDRDLLGKMGNMDIGEFFKTQICDKIGSDTHRLLVEKTARLLGGYHQLGFQLSLYQAKKSDLMLPEARMAIEQLVKGETPIPDSVFNLLANSALMSFTVLINTSNNVVTPAFHRELYSLFFEETTEFGLPLVDLICAANKGDMGWSNFVNTPLTMDLNEWMAGPQVKVLEAYYGVEKGRRVAEILWKGLQVAYENASEAEKDPSAILVEDEAARKNHQTKLERKANNQTIADVGAYETDQFFDIGSHREKSQSGLAIFSPDANTRNFFRVANGLQLFQNIEGANATTRALIRLGAWEVEEERTTEERAEQRTTERRADEKIVDRKKMEIRLRNRAGERKTITITRNHDGHAVSFVVIENGTPVPYEPAAGVKIGDVVFEDPFLVNLAGQINIAAGRRVGRFVNLADVNWQATDPEGNPLDIPSFYNISFTDISGRMLIPPREFEDPREDGRNHPTDILRVSHGPQDKVLVITPGMAICSIPMPLLTHPFTGNILRTSPICYVPINLSAAKPVPGGKGSFDYLLGYYPAGKGVLSKDLALFGMGVSVNCFSKFQEDVGPAGTIFPPADSPNGAIVFPVKSRPRNPLIGGN